MLSVLLAMMAGDPGWVLRVVERSALDPEHPDQYTGLADVYLDHLLMPCVYHE